MAQKAPNPVPDGMHTLTVHLWFNGNCNDAIEFYQKALGAALMAPVVPGSNGKGVMHAMVKVGDTPIMMADSWPGSWEKGPDGYSTAGLWLYVDDCDKAFEKAVNAGCEVIMPLEDAFWGDRHGTVKDPFGHCWAIATHKWVFTPEEMQQRQEEWLSSLSG